MLLIGLNNFICDCCLLFVVPCFKCLICRWVGEVRDGAMNTLFPLVFLLPVGYLIACYIHMPSDPVDVAEDTNVRHCKQVVSSLNERLLA